MPDRHALPPDAPASAPAPPGARAVFALSWPMALKAIFLHGTVVIDGWLVSSLGESAVAAMGLAAAVAGMVLGVIFAFSHAMQIRTAQAFGTGDPVYMKSVLACGLAISLAIGLVGLAAIFMFGPAILAAIAPDPGIAALAWGYLAVFSLVILGEAIGQCLASYFNGCGRTRIPLYGYCLSVPVNITSSVVLIHGLLGMPAFGVVGAAMGSALGIAVQVGYILFETIRTDARLRRVPGWRQTTFGQSLSRHLRFALPIAATFISATFATHVCMLIYANMSLSAFAALTLIAPWIMVAGQISMQWTQATGILVAQLLGQRAPEATLDQFLSAAWRGAFVTAGIVATVFFLLTMSVNWLYADLARETRDVLVSFLPLLLILPFPRATNAICGNTLRASGDTIYVMHLFLWSQWLFRVLATAIAVLVFDVSAFWVMAIILGEEALKFWPFHHRLYRGNWKRAVVSE